MQIGITWTTGWSKMLLSTTEGAATAATSAAALSQKPRLYKTVSLNEITCIKLITTDPEPPLGAARTPTLELGNLSLPRPLERVVRRRGAEIRESTQLRPYRYEFPT